MNFVFTKIIKRSKLNGLNLKFQIVLCGNYQTSSDENMHSEYIYVTLKKKTKTFNR